MKHLTLIVHADMEQPLADVLRALPGVPGFTFTRIESHGPQDERDPALSARDRVVGYTPHVRVDIVLADDAVDRVLEALRKNHVGVAGRGRFWVTDIERHGRI